MRSGITLYLSVSSTFIFVISNCRNKEPAKISEVILFIFHLLAGSHKCNCSEITSLSPKVMDTQVAFFFRLTRRNGSAPLCSWWKLPPCRMPKKKKKSNGRVAVEALRWTGGFGPQRLVEKQLEKKLMAGCFVFFSHFIALGEQVVAHVLSKETGLHQ